MFSNETISVISSLPNCGGPTKRHCALRETPKGGKNIILLEGKVLVSIPISNILFVRAEHVYVRIFFANNQQLLRRISLAEMLDVLPKDQFIQVHRSYIVNLDRVDRCDKQFLYVDKHAIPVSRRRLVAVLDRLQK